MYFGMPALLQVLCTPLAVAAGAGQLENVYHRPGFRSTPCAAVLRRTVGRSSRRPVNVRGDSRAPVLRMMTQLLYTRRVVRFLFTHIRPTRTRGHGCIEWAEALAARSALISAGLRVLCGVLRTAVLQTSQSAGPHGVYCRPEPSSADGPFDGHRGLSSCRRYAPSTPSSKLDGVRRGQLAGNETP